MDIRVGDRVSVRWDETDKRFNATVEAINDMPWSFDVLYDEKVRGKPCVEKKVSIDRVLRFGSPSPTHRQRGSSEGEDLYVVDDEEEEEEELFRSFHSNEDEDDGMYWGEGTIESAAAAAAAATLSVSGNKRKEINILKYLCSLREEEEEEGKEVAVDIKLSVRRSSSYYSLRSPLYSYPLTAQQLSIVLAQRTFSTTLSSPSPQVNQIIQLHDALSSPQIAEMIDTPGPTGRGLLELSATLLNEALMCTDVDTAFDAAFQGMHNSIDSIDSRQPLKLFVFHFLTFKH